jgi:hypothetical protein
MRIHFRATAQKYLFRTLCGRTFLLSESIHGVVKFLEWFGTAISASVGNVLPTVLCRLSLIAFALAVALSSPAAEVEVAPIKGGQFVGALVANHPVVTAEPGKSTTNISRGCRKIFTRARTLF